MIRELRPLYSTYTANVLGDDKWSTRRGKMAQSKVDSRSTAVV